MSNSNKNTIAVEVQKNHAFNLEPKQLELKLEPPPITGN